jgi:quercetin dioxygenase-like cupin family protein
MRMELPAARLFDWPADDLIAALPAEADPVWDRYAARQEQFPAHRRTRSIRFIWVDELRPGLTPEIVDEAPVALRDAAMAAGRAIAGHYGGTILRLMLTEMAPGTAIPRHIDTGDMLTHSHRCHMAVVTNSRVRFEVGRHSLHFAPGEVWEFDNMRRHAVINLGETRRVHLICNVLPADSVFR